jgi:hypothetical protein
LDVFSGVYSARDVSAPTYDWMVGPTHDVGATYVMPSKTVVGQGYSLDTMVTAADMGSYSETFNVTLYANTTSITSLNVTLSAGNSTNIMFSWNTTVTPYGNYAISAYAWPVPGETNMASNNCTGGQITVTIPGDVNGDFKVDLKDLVILASAYGSKPGAPNWNPNADIDGKGTVGLSDLVILAQHYGQSVSP